MSYPIGRLIAPHRLVTYTMYTVRISTMVSRGVIVSLIQMFMRMFNAHIIELRIHKCPATILI